MDVKGKINVFVEKLEGKNGNSYQRFWGSISHKHEDGTYTNARIELQFGNDFVNKDKLTQLKENTAYEFEIVNGWLDCKAWENAEGKKEYRIMIHIREANLLSSKEVNKTAKKGLPF